MLPTFAVLSSMEPVRQLLEQTGANLGGLIHSGQTLTLHRDLEVGAELTTTAEVTGVYDLKRLAQILITTTTCDEAGNPVASNEWQLVLRFDGGFGGEPPPKRDRFTPPTTPADWTFEQHTTREQALLYRLSGDHNPLHAEPAVATSVGFEAPILHGLCTYGIVGRAVLAQSNGTPFGTLSGVFKNPVWPGDTLVIEGWKEPTRTLLRATVPSRGAEAVFQGAYTAR